MYLLAFEVFLLTTAVIKRNNQAVTASIFVLIGTPQSLLPSPPHPPPPPSPPAPPTRTCLSPS